MAIKKTSIIILAAGKGSRMSSDFPKVLYKIAGKPMIEYIIETALSLDVSNIYLVYNDNLSFFKKKFINKSINWVCQKNILGTGHAVKQVYPYFKDDEKILILYGDHPLIRKKTLEKLIKLKLYKGIGLLTAIVKDPNGYGRVFRKNGKVVKIIEQKDLVNDQGLISEINTGVLIVNSKDLKRWLKKIKNNNFQNEYYITDIINFAYQENYRIHVFHPKKISEMKGVNNFNQLFVLNRIYQREKIKKLLSSGVMFADPSRVDFRGTLEHGKNVFIDINVIIEGKVILGNNVRIYSGCILKNCIINDNSIIYPYTFINQTKLSKNCRIGPFAHLRPGTRLKESVSIGNFVELKNTIFGNYSKAGHLSYLGDAEIGSNVNIGAGTITCNYDGLNKFKTKIKDNVFVGADSQLIAPVVLGKDSTIGAGTTLTKNVKKKELVISRVKQKHISNWKRPIRK